MFRGLPTRLKEEVMVSPEDGRREGKEENAARVKGFFQEPGS